MKSLKFKYFAVAVMTILFHSLEIANASPKVTQKNNELFLSDGKTQSPVTVEEATEKDFNAIVAIDWENFPHDNASLDYVKERVRSQWNHPGSHLSRYYVIKSGMQVAGFALWVVRSGFKSTMSAELERLAIQKDFRLQRFGTALARLSIDLFEKFQNSIHPELNPRFSVILLTTGSDNPSNRLYQSALGVQSKGKIGAVFGPNAYGDEEILMINEKFIEFTQNNPLANFLVD